MNPILSYTTQGARVYGACLKLLFEDARRQAHPGHCPGGMP